MKFINVASVVGGAVLGGVLTAVFLATDWSSRRERHVQDAVNDAKMGNYVRARKAFEDHLVELGPVELSLLAEFYALGQGGPRAEFRATTLLRMLQCRFSVSGGIEHDIATQLAWKDRVAATRWLVRAAEAGYPEAIELLSDQERLINSGFSLELPDINNWQGVKFDETLMQVARKLGCRLPRRWMEKEGGVVD